MEVLNKNNHFDVSGILRGNKTKKAFTLIELLVVISIIAVLMSIMLPSLKKVRELAKSTVCLSNYHSIGMASTLYCADNDGYLPLIFRGLDPEVQASNPAWSTAIWSFDLAPYVAAGDKNLHVDVEEVIKTVFYCKSHPKTYKDPQTKQELARVSYGPNAKILMDVANDTSCSRVAYTRFRRDKIPKCADKIYAGEKKLDENYAWVHHDGTSATAFKLDRGTKYDGIAAECHGGKTNFLMFDGSTISSKDPYEITMWGFRKD